MDLETENQTMVPDEVRNAKARYTITRGRDAVPHSGHPQRDGQPHPAVVRGMGRMREVGDSGGAAAVSLFAMPTLHVSYAWFKSGYPLPLHSHDVDCYYLVIAGSMKLGNEVLEKGDGVLIPSGAPYTVNPGPEGVEFIEMRTSPDYDTHYRGKTDSYWDRIIDTHKARKDIWAEEKAPYGFLGGAR